MSPTPHAKFKRANHPALRQMLGPERAQALERALGLIDLRLAQASSGPARDKLQEKRQKVEAMLMAVRRLPS
ncbi:MAG: hypothetical protein HY676_02730 [Chloroflexi bacterium]|nr:hypothetical protein [Chloroflexota bacterium]